MTEPFAQRAERFRSRFRFDVERLRDASSRLQKVDLELRHARRRLHHRAEGLSDEARALDGTEQGRVQLLSAKALAVASLARRAAIRDLLANAPTGVAFVAAMAVSQWVWELQGLRAEPKGAARIRAHVEAGRIAYRVLRSLRQKKGLIAGVSRMSSAVVVAEFVHPSDAASIEHLIDEGFERGLKEEKGRTEEEVLAGVSAAIRESAAILERIADRAEPALQKLLDDEENVEARVEAHLGRAG